MLKKISFIALALVLPLLFGNAHALAQTDEHKFEVGALFTSLHLDNFPSRASLENENVTVNGIGARIGYDFTENIALDAEANFFPETHFGNNQLGQKTQAFVGVKAGKRFERFGLFAKARPGVMFIGEITSSLDCNAGQNFTVCRPNHNNFAFDAGGAAEFYPTKRAIIRVDAGDTIIRLKQSSGGLLFPAPSTTNTTNNFQASIGFGYRF